MNKLKLVKRRKALADYAMVDAALKYHRLGWSIIPIRPHSDPYPEDSKGKLKVPYVKWKIHQSVRASEQEIKQWWEKWPDAQIGVVTGKISKLAVVDLDEPMARQRLENEVCQLPDTIMQSTGRLEGGRHLIFKYPEDGGNLRNFTGKIEGVDFRAEGGFFVVAPSIHKSGNRYTWLKGNPLNHDLKYLAELPEELKKFCEKDIVSKKNEKNQSVKASVLEGVPEGKRDASLFEYACHLRDQGISYEEAWVLIEHAAEKCDPPFPKNEAIKKINSAYRYESRSNALGCESFRDQIERLNKDHAAVLLGGRFVVMNEVTDPVFKRPDVTFSSISDFKNRYANQKVVYVDNNVKLKEVSIANKWLESQHRREYNGIVFSPGKEVDGYYNLYRGLALGPMRGDWDLFRDHIIKIICGQNMEYFKWLMAWMARIVQDPGGERPGTSIVLRGKQGSGKGCFATLFGKIFWPHFLHITNQNQITGRFNNHLKNALVVFCDEAIWAGNKPGEGVIKGMITEELFMVEPKGKDAFAIKNYINLIIASNNDWVIPAGLEERRFFVLDVADDRVQDRVYFNAIFDQMKNGGCEAMLSDLQRYNYSEFDLRTAPRTEALMDQITHSMTVTQHFWFERLTEGLLSKDHNDWQEWIPTQDLYTEFEEFAKQVGIRRKPPDSQFSKELRKLSSGVVRTRRKVGTNHVGAKRSMGLSFPNLKTCREQFENAVRMKIDWPS